MHRTTNISPVLEVADIKLVFKSGKDPSLVNSYHLIFLLKYIGKMFENVFLRLLLNEVFSKELLHHNQFGFRTGFSLEGWIYTCKQHPSSAHQIFFSKTT